jgi:TetR/AcrR family fatty acid metabolism transcriptional regulator
MASSQSSARDSGKRSHEKYERILEAALEVFAAKGFHEAKVTEIARTAGIADGTIYLYFKNKDDLLISLFESRLEQINSGLRAQLAETSNPSEQVESFIRYHLRLAEQSPMLAAFITVELRRSAKFIKEYAKKQLTEYLDQLGRVIERGKEDGSFRNEVSTGILKHLVFGALDHTCQIWVVNPHRRPEDLHEVGDQLTELVLRSISAQP